MQEHVPEGFSGRGYGKLAAALAKAQKAFPKIPRSETVSVTTRTGSKYEFSYAPFEAIISAVRAPLAENGIAVLQTLARNGDGFIVRTILLHESGEYFVSGGTPVVVVEQGPQAFGSALTYSKRYDLSLTLNLATEDDDDANVAEGNVALKERPQRDEAFYEQLAAAAKNGTEALKKAWMAGTPAQRKSCKEDLDDLKRRAEIADEAKKAIP